MQVKATIEGENGRPATTTTFHGSFGLFPSSSLREKTQERRIANDAKLSAERFCEQITSVTVKHFLFDSM